MNAIQTTTGRKQIRLVDGVVSHNGTLTMEPRFVEQGTVIASYVTKSGKVITARGLSEASAIKNLKNKLGMK